jgi:hypothetical protein
MGVSGGTPRTACVHSSGVACPGELGWGLVAAAPALMDMLNLRGSGRGGGVVNQGRRCCCSCCIGRCMAMYAAGGSHAELDAAAPHLRLSLPC